MPAFAFSRQPQPARRYDVIGVHSATLSSFVRHVALFNNGGGAVCLNQNVDVVHMGPPLVRHGKAKASVMGVVPLTNDEVREIEIWIAQIDDEYAQSRVGPLRQYIINPPWQDWPPNGVRRYRRYSCAGFVLDAYRAVDIHLLELDEQSLPPVDKDALCAAYPEAANPRMLQRLDLQGTGPWRIVLAGYVLHALNRAQEQIRQEPYRAQPGNERFPQ
jgi:hypothetical protein